MKRMKQGRVNPREMEKEIRDFLKGAAGTTGASEGEQGWLHPEEKRKQETLAFLRTERRKLRFRPRKSFAERLLAQASWMSPGAWIGQLAVLVFFFLLLGNTGWNRRDALLLVTACTPLPGVIGLVELLRSWQSGMWELEEACRYHLRQIQGMRLLVFGIADSIGVAAVFVMGFLEGYAAELLLLFFLFPLLVSDSVFLLLAKTFRKGARGLVPVLGGLGMGIFWMYQASWLQDVPGTLEEYTAPGTLTALLAGSVCLLAFACARFLNETDKEEQGLWNCA